MNPDSERFDYDVKHEGDDPTNIFNIYQKDGDGIFQDYPTDDLQPGNVPAWVRIEMKDNFFWDTDGNVSFYEKATLYLEVRDVSESPPNNSTFKLILTAKPQNESPILHTPDPTKRHFDINENTEVVIPDLVASDQEKMSSSLYWELPKSYLGNEYFELRDGPEGEGKREFDGNRTALYFKNSPNFESGKLDYNATLYIRDSRESEIEPTSVTFSFSIKNVLEAPRPKAGSLTHGRLETPVDEQLEDDPSSWPTIDFNDYFEPEDEGGDIFFTRNYLYDEAYTLEDGVLTFKKAPDADSGNGKLIVPLVVSNGQTASAQRAEYNATILFREIPEPPLYKEGYNSTDKILTFTINEDEKFDQDSDESESAPEGFKTEIPEQVPNDLKKYFRDPEGGNLQIGETTAIQVFINGTERPNYLSDSGLDFSDVFISDLQSNGDGRFIFHPPTDAFGLFKVFFTLEDNESKKIDARFDFNVSEVSDPPQIFAVPADSSTGQFVQKF